MKDTKTENVDQKLDSLIEELDEQDLENISGGGRIFWPPKIGVVDVVICSGSCIDWRPGFGSIINPVPKIR